MNVKRLSFFSFASALFLSLSAQAAPNPFLGEWALTIPGNNAGWLGVEEKGGTLNASLLWGWGSVTPLESAKLDGEKLILNRKHVIEKTEPDGKKTKKTFIEVITATVSGDDLKLTSVKPKESGTGEDTAEFSGKRQPPMPPAPDLSKVKFGEPISLFNGKNLEGWKLTDPKAANGWSVKDGLLHNNPLQVDGRPHRNYGNLRTDGEFSDFKISLQVRLPEKGNSGLYLRGIYEIQVADTYGKPPSAHGMGALYSRVAPTANPSKPAGQWQTMEVTLVDRHVTVVLNGEKILDNIPVLGCTGGALWSDVTRPGPFYLQGDHTGVEYKDIVVRPVVK